MRFTSVVAVEAVSGVVLLIEAPVARSHETDEFERNLCSARPSVASAAGVIYIWSHFQEFLSSTRQRKPDWQNDCPLSVLIWLAYPVLGHFKQGFAYGVPQIVPADLKGFPRVSCERYGPSR